MIGRHPNIQKGWVHRARKGTVALVFATAIGTLSGLALNPQPAHALFEGNGMYVKGQVLWSGVIVLCPSGWVMR